MYNSIKKENMQKKITQYVEKVLINADANDSLDYFKIDVTNHNGTLQLEHQYRKREKAY